MGSLRNRSHLVVPLFGTNIVLACMNFHSCIGIGFSDSELYADRLGKFSYLNAFCRREPRLDISDPELAPEFLESQDFVISSDVFEMCRAADR